MLSSIFKESSADTLLLLTAGTFAILLIVVIILILRNNTLLKKLNQTNDHEALVKSAEERSNEILWKAIEDAKKIRVAAELEGIKRIAEEKLQSRKIGSEYKESLDALTKNTIASFNEYRAEIHKELKGVLALAEKEIHGQIPAITGEVSEAKERVSATLGGLTAVLQKTEHTYTKFVATIEEMAQEQFDQETRAIKEKLQHIPEHLDKAVNQLETEGKKMMASRFEEEFEKAKKQIDAYRTDYYRFLDDAIVTLVKETTESVLQKKLYLDDHAELVMRALEEARRHSVFK